MLSQVPVAKDAEVFVIAQLNVRGTVGQTTN
jgi:hypothetical protein